MLGFWKDKTCNVCANDYKDFKNNYDSLNRENDRYKKDERMLSYFLKGFEEELSLRTKEHEKLLKTIKLDEE